MNLFCEGFVRIYFHEFRECRPNRKNKFSGENILINSRENKFSRELVLAKISTFKVTERSCEKHLILNHQCCKRSAPFRQAFVVVDSNSASVCLHHDTREGSCTTDLLFVFCVVHTTFTCCYCCLLTCSTTTRGRWVRCFWSSR